MSTSEPSIILLAAFPGSEATRILARRPDGTWKRWALGTGTAAAARDLVGFCQGADRILTNDDDALTRAIGSSSAAAAARSILTSLTDLRELSLLFSPLEPPLVIEPPQESDPDSPVAALDQLEAAWQAIRKAIAAAPPALLEVLAPLLAGDPSFSWLPWPDADSSPLALTRVGQLLPGRPPRRKRAAASQAVEGDPVTLSAESLGPDGPVAGCLPAYEHRPGQVEMASQVASALRDEQLLLMEAGTGVGKSLAYLVPAILHALQAQEPVVVSTNTRNLQDQLVDKDLPFLQRTLPYHFEWALVKGRRNYPCLRALVSAGYEAVASLFRAERLAVAYLISWLAQAPNTDLESVPPHALDGLGELQALLGAIRSQGDACAGKACAYADACPVEVARAWARRADLVISNHALTLADTRTTVLPEYTRLILDEAQNLESVATDALSLEFSQYAAGQFLRSLTGPTSGFVRMVTGRLEALATASGDHVGVTSATDALAKLAPLAEHFDAAVGAMGEVVVEFCRAAPRTARDDPDRLTVRLSDPIRSSSEWAVVGETGGEALSAGVELLAALEAFCESLAPLDKSACPEAAGLDADCAAMPMRLHGLLDALTTVLMPPAEGPAYVTWAETWQTRRGLGWSLRAAPVNVGEVLRQGLYQRKSSIVFTSATITVEGGFEYFRQRLGLEREAHRLVETTVASPFDLTEQLLLCVPRDMPMPNDPAFNRAVADAITQVCGLADGGALVLFTARNRMLQAFEATRAELLRQGLRPVCQEVTGTRTALLDRLRQDPRTVLFGLKSFWEGVDVPGDALRCVVITKLPFAVPSDPLIEARQEDAARRGLNPMEDYYIPEAVVGFKQGFGRLIRTRTDRGVVFVLDTRILTRAYGRRFFRSVPRCELVRDDMEACLRQADRWLWS